MRHFKLWLALLTLAVLPGLVPALHAQKTLASIHGHASDPAGTSISSGEVRISPDGKAIKYTFPLDSNGDYKGTDIVPGTYYILLWQKDPATQALKQVDFFENVAIAAGANMQQDFDMSRAEYMKKLTPEQQKAIAEAKAKNADIVKGNQDVKKLNSMLADARADIVAKKFDEAATLMGQATQMKPDQGVLWLELGIAQDGLKKYDDAIANLKKAIELNAAAKPPKPEVEGAAQNALGEAYAKTNKSADAATAYEAGAKAQPENAAMYYSNETIVLSQSGAPTDAVVAAADKAIAADPKRAIPYYLKGQALINKATVDPKTQKIIAPPGTEEAYEKYLELAPTGAQANDAKAVLQEIGSKQATRYSAGKKN